MIITRKANWKRKLLTTENAKTPKGMEKKGVLTGILYLAPSVESVPHGGKDLCPWASNGCAKACIFFQGRGKFQKVHDARIDKTLYYIHDNKNFMEDLRSSIHRIRRIAKRLDYIPAIRLNGSSDVLWEKTGIFEEFPDVMAYDYTKSPKRAFDYDAGKLPPNYHLTFSRSESNEENVRDVVENTQTNVAVVFSSKVLPKTYMGREVINGDETDVRFMDPKGVIVGLYAKGTGKRDETGFVVQV